VKRQEISAITSIINLRSFFALPCMACLIFGFCLILPACDSGEGDGDRSTLSGKDDAAAECIMLCELALGDEVDLSEGPCMSEEVIDDWACDIAHNPRTDVDDLETNQCDSWPNEAAHFVELDTNCSLIQAQ